MTATAITNERRRQYLQSQLRQVGHGRRCNCADCLDMRMLRQALQNLNTPRGDGDRGSGSRP